MKLFIFLVLVSLPLVSTASDYKHQISFGRQGLGWGGSYEEMSTKSKSPFNKGKHLFSDIAFNYAFRLSARWQIGAFYQTGRSDYTFKRRDGRSTFADVTTFQGGIFGLYNFSEELQSAYYLGVSVSFFSMAEENSHNWMEAEGKAPFELDDSGTTSELTFGKRFSFERWEIKHLTYSPSVGIFHRTHSKDFDDQNIGNGLGVILQPIKFDFLF